STLPSRPPANQPGWVVLTLICRSAVVAARVPAPNAPPPRNTKIRPAPPLAPGAPITRSSRVALLQRTVARPAPKFALAPVLVIASGGARPPARPPPK